MADPRDELAYADLANEPGLLPPRDPTAAARAMWQQRYASPEPTSENQRALGKGIGALVHGASEALQIPDRMFEGVRVERDPAATWQQVEQARRQQVGGATEAALNLLGTGAPLAAGRGATVGSSGGVLRGKLGGPWEGGIRAYHSSPHDFDRFDWSKLRTGEGANSYGAGFYAAENPAVSGQGGQYWNQFLGRMPKEEMRSAEWLKQHGFDRDAAADAVRAELERTKEVLARGAHPIESQITAIRQKHADTLQQRLDALTSGAPVGPRTYEVNINARPELMLDWDKPVSAQSPHVKDVLATKFGWTPEGYTLPSGKLAPRIGGPIGATAYNDLQLGLANKYAVPERGRAASEALAEAGIPGIRYLDQGSRGQKYWVARHPQGGTSEYPSEAEARAFITRNPEYRMEAPQQTYNYVVTDPSKLDILAKYGIVGTAGAGGIGSLVDPSRYRETQ